MARFTSLVRAPGARLNPAASAASCAAAVNCRPESVSAQVRRLEQAMRIWRRRAASPAGEDRVLVRLAERHRPASLVPRRAQPEVPGWAEWASSAITTSPGARSAAR